MLPNTPISTNASTNSNGIARSRNSATNPRATAPGDGAERTNRPRHYDARAPDQRPRGAPAGDIGQQADPEPPRHPADRAARDIEPHRRPDRGMGDLFAD